MDDGSGMLGSQSSVRAIQASDIVIEVTDKENKYRKQLFPERGSVLKANVRCTACGTSLLKNLTKGKDLFFHPILHVLVCEDCRAFYGDGNFPLDDDNSDTYCRWCAQGGSLYCCSGCNFVFCKPCIRRNFKKSMLDEIEEEDWKCFVCNPESLWMHRAICWASRKYIKENPGDDEDEIESSNDEGRREKRRAAREKKWQKKGKGEEESSRERPKKSKPTSRPHSARKSITSDEEDDEYSSSKRHREKKAGKDKSKEAEKHHGSKKNKRMEKGVSEEADDDADDDDNDGKRHRHKKLKERDKGHKPEKGKEVEQSTSKSPKKDASADRTDRSALGENGETEENRDLDEEARQISVMQKTCHHMELLLKETYSATSASSKKVKLIYDWIAEKKKVSGHDQLTTTPAKFTKMLEAFRKILQKLRAHTEELQGKELEAEKEWMAIVEGDEEDEQLKMAVDGDKKEVDESKLNGLEKSGSSLNFTEGAGLVDGNISDPENILVGGETMEISDPKTGDESDFTEADKSKEVLDAPLNRSMGNGEVHPESTENENGEKTLGKGNVSDLERSSSPEHMDEGNCESDGLNAEGIGKEIGDEEKSCCKEKAGSHESESSPCKTMESVKGEDKNKIRAVGNTNENGEERMSDDGGEKSDVEGHAGEEMTSEAKGESGKNDVVRSDGEVVGNDPDIDMENGEDSAKNSEGNSKKEESEGKKDEFESSIQDLFESDVENNVNMASIITQLNSKSSIPGSDEIGKDSIVDRERTGVDELEKGSVNNEKLENENVDSEMTYTTIKPSSDDRNAKMSFLLDTSLSSWEESDSEKATKNKKQHGNKSGVSSSESESVSEIESDDSSKEVTVKKTKKSRGKISISSLLSQYDDERLKAGCFVTLERLKNDNYKTVDLKVKNKKRDSLMKAISRLGDLASLDRTETKLNATDSDSDNDSDELYGKNKKKKVKKTSKSKESEEVTEKDFSDNEDKLMDCDLEKINGPSKIDENINSAEKMMDDLAAELLAISSPNSDSSSSGSEYKPKTKKSDDETKNNAKSKQKKDKVVKEKIKKESGDESSSSDEEVVSSKSSWRRDKLLNEKLSATDSSEEERKWKAKKEKEKELSSESEKDSDSEDVKTRKKTRRRLRDSDSDIFEVSSSVKSCDSSDFETTKKKRKRKTGSDSSSDKGSGSKLRKKKRLRRIKMLDSASEEEEKKTEKQEEGDEEEEEEQSSKKKGRKDIRKVLKGDRLAEETKAAAKDEEERLKRIAERQKMYNDIFTDKQNLEVLNNLVLDFDPDTKKALVSVHPTLVKKLKPHQAEGVKFMWEACFESLKRMEESKGSGCILAHCMGLGKTLQVIALVHTLLTNPRTKINTVLVICPLNTALNWVNEFQYWLKDMGSGGDVEVFELTKYKVNAERMYQLKDWQKDGGVMVIGYEMYRNLSYSATGKRVRKKLQDVFRSTLVDPGPDLVICDEGHLLKNIASALSKAVNSIRTARRIILTGTPLQNNLKEYHCMIQFVKPNLLGTTKEFLNRFVNPITNGQLAESTPHDVRVMKRRAHVLHKMLEGCVQRRDYLVLTPFLPPKYEYVIGIQLTELQSKLYIHYLENFVNVGGGATLFNDFQNLQRIWTHPRLLKIKAEIQEKKRLLESDSEGSLKDFIDDDETTTSSFESSDSEKEKKKKGTKKGSSSAGSSSESDVVCINDDSIEKAKDSKDDGEKEIVGPPQSSKEWWENYVVPEDYEKVDHSGKLVLLFDILQKCELIGDKVLVFSQSLVSLDVIEYFLEVIDDQTQKLGGNVTVEDSEKSTSPNKFVGSWTKGLDYFRIDGTVSAENRSQWCKIFNTESNLRARLFLISTRAGGMGINLIGANRVILFDASWNPSNDLQSIFRLYRFGQTKPCYVYRFLAQSTMEEKIYNRQVTKLSLALRVVDEQQIERHFNLDDLQELYRYEPKVKTKRPTPMLPKDRLLAELIQKYPDLIDNYHEHDSLLENKTEEELNEEERKAAWEDFENDKKGKLPENIPMVGGDGAFGAFGGMISQMFHENSIYGDNALDLRTAIMERHPNATEEQIATELALAASRISTYFTNASYPQQFYNASQVLNRPTMNMFPGQYPRFPQQMSLMQSQHGLQNLYHNPVVPTNHNRMMPQMVGSTSQHVQPPQGVRMHQFQPQSIHPVILPQGNGTTGPQAPKLKIRSDLMPASVSNSNDNDIIIESVKRREN